MGPQRWDPEPYPKGLVTCRLLRRWPVREGRERLHWRQSLLLLMCLMKTIGVGGAEAMAQPLGALVLVKDSD